MKDRIIAQFRLLSLYKPMKIAIIGTHSTGKTTLIKLLHCELQLNGIDAYVLPEFSRLCPYPINEDSTLQAQAWIQQEQITQERLHHNDDRVLICDRATIDNFAYMHVAAKGMRVQHHEQRAVEHMSSYDAVFKTYKLPVPAKHDGIRTTNDEFRDKIDSWIEYFLYKHDLPFFLLPKTIDYMTHVDFIMATIEQIKNPSIEARMIEEITN